MRAVSLITSFVLVSAIASVACVGAPPPPPGSDGSGSSSVGGSETAGLVPVTTAPVEDTSGTAGGTGPNTGGSDAGTGTSSSSGATTMGVDPTTGSSSGGPPPECVVPGDCPSNETCDAMGQCVSACNPWGPGDYGYCLTPLGGFDSATLCGEAQSCINSGNPIEVVVCGRSCAAQCDCPAPPATGNAIVSCGDLTGGGSGKCYLSCEDGETCPDGMVCRDSGGLPSHCAHPVQALPMYGNCGNVAAPCINGTCSTASDGTDWAVCISLCVGGIGECDAAPPGIGAVVSCESVISPPMGPDCHLDCNFGGDCPSGMDCLDFGMDNMCMWPT